MSSRTTPAKGRPNPPDAARAVRLKAALKANIAKRKAQARARDAGADGSDKEKP